MSVSRNLRRRYVGISLERLWIFRLQLDEILATGRFRMIIAVETLRTLDAQKATNVSAHSLSHSTMQYIQPRARTATDWLLRKTSQADGPVRIQQRRDESVDINCLKTNDR